MLWRIGGIRGDDNWSRSLLPTIGDAAVNKGGCEASMTVVGVREQVVEHSDSIGARPR